MTKPLVSILMPTLDSERTLALCLASIRRQTLGAEAVEILIADGGSKDATRAIAAEYGAVVLENPRVLPEFGLSVALAASRGRYGVFVGSDEVMTHEGALAIKVRLLEENPRCHNVTHAGLMTPEGYPRISDYLNRFGDPFSFFMHRLDAGDHLHALRERYSIVREESDYVVLGIGKSEVLPIIDGGHFFRIDHLRTLADLSDHTVIARLFTLMALEHRQLGVVKNDRILHHSATEYRVAKAKVEWRIVNNIHHVASGAVGFVGREQLQPRSFRLKKYLFIPYALSIAGPALDAARLTIEYKNSGMLYHLPLAVGAGVSILKHTALKALGVKVGQKAYGK